MARRGRNEPVITFCLVHGAWHDDACWQPLVSELARRGHECVTPVLPLERADASFEDYAQVVVDRLEGRDAPVLVGHSMSSAVIPLVATKRPVRLLVYLCPAMGGFPAPADEPPYQRQGYERPPTDAKNRAGGRASEPSASSTPALTPSSPNASPADCVPNRKRFQRPLPAQTSTAASFRSPIRARG